MSDKNYFTNDYSFEYWVQQAIEDLPEWVRLLLDKYNVSIVIKEQPDVETRKRFKEDILGIFTGRSLPNQKAPGMPGEPTRIELYRTAFRKHYQHSGERKLNVKQTIIHEVGHFMGLDEEQIRQRGY